MSDNVSIAIDGAAALDSALKQMESKVANKFVTRALRAGAKPIQQQAKANVPVKTGALRKSIKVRAGRRHKGIKSIIVGTARKWFTGPTFYGAFLEFGHRVGARKLGNKRAEVKPVEFLAKAADSKKSAAIAAITESLKTDLETFKPGTGGGES